MEHQKENNKQPEKRRCNTTAYAHSGLSAVNSQCHVPMLLNHTDACTQTHNNVQECTRTHTHTHTLSSPLSSASSRRRARATHALIRTYFFFFRDQRKSWLQHFSPLQKSSQCQNDKWGIMRESVHTYIRLHKSFKSCNSADERCFQTAFRRRFEAVVITQKGPTCKLHATTVISNVKLLST